MKIGTRLPSAWAPAVGTNVGLVNSVRSVPSLKPVPVTPAKPNNSFWVSVNVPAFTPFAFFDTAKVQLTYEPAISRGRLNIRTSRKLNIGGIAVAGISDKYVVTYDTMNDVVTDWKTHKVMNLAIEKTDTRIIADIQRQKGAAFAEADFKVEQPLFDLLKLSGSAFDVLSETPSYRLQVERRLIGNVKLKTSVDKSFQARPVSIVGVEKTLFGILHVSSSVRDVTSDTPQHTILAKLSHRW